MSLTDRDAIRLEGVHPDLVKVATLAVQRVPGEMPGVTLFITEGVRTHARQAQLVKAGASRTMKSKHLTGDAFDFALKVGDEVRWDTPLFKQAAQIVKACAEDLGVAVVSGGDWRTFKDYPHIERAV